MLRHIFLHNNHDKLSRERLAACQAAGLTFETVKPYEGQGFQGLQVRALPAYVVVSDVSGVVASFEGESLDPTVIALMTFEDGPLPIIEPTPEQRIADLEEALAAKDMELKQALMRLDDIEEAIADVDFRLRKVSP